VAQIHVSGFGRLRQGRRRAGLKSRANHEEPAEAGSRPTLPPQTSSPLMGDDRGEGENYHYHQPGGRRRRNQRSSEHKPLTV
jgi:hypothetical protein